MEDPDIIYKDDGSVTVSAKPIVGTGGQSTSTPQKETPKWL
jgi:hypothetical protein